MYINLTPPQFAAALNWYARYSPLEYNVKHAELICDYFSQIEVLPDVSDLYRICYPTYIRPLLKMMKRDFDFPYEIDQPTREKILNIVKNEKNYDILIDFETHSVIVIDLSRLQELT